MAERHQPQRPLQKQAHTGRRQAAARLGAGLLFLALLGCGPRNLPPGTSQPQPALPTPTPFPPPSASTIGETWLHPVDEMTLVFVPAGAFLLGTDPTNPAGDPNESPLRKITLSAFWIDQTEVTNGMYAYCVLDGGCTEPVPGFSLTRQDYYTNLAYAEYPVVNVTWQQAAAYCAWAGRRLPTEAEWEKAARGTDGRTYPWGEAPPTCNLLMFGDPGPGQASCGQDTAPVAGYPAGASPYGAFDMAGNVWEWTADWFDPGAYAGFADFDPTGPESGDGRVLRGGAYNDAPENVRAANRHHTAPENPSYQVGFRCAVSAAP